MFPANRAFGQRMIIGMRLPFLRVPGRRTGAAVAGVLLALGLLTACGGTGSKGSATTAPTTGAASGPTITIKNFSFHGDLTVAAGATVTVHNSDGAGHTFTAKDKSFDTGPIDPGQSKTFTAPTKPGKYPVTCTFHPSMSGTLTVTAG